MQAYVLCKREGRVLSAFAQVLFQSNQTLKHTPEDVHLVERIDEGLRVHRPDLRFFFRFALFLFEWLACLRYFKPFSALDLRRQEVYFNRWFHTRVWPLRGLLRLLESICYVYYYGDPDVARALGYDEKEVQAQSPAKPVPAGMLSMPDRDIIEEVEICVIGSGAGGAVVACELAEKGHQVLILEEGAYFAGPDFEDNTVHINQKIYRDAGFVVTYGKPPILVPTASAVGGTTVINSGTCYRTPDSVLRQWQSEGLATLSSQAMDPYFARVERRLGIAPVPPEVFGENNRTILRGIEALGMTGIPLLRNAPGCKGHGHCIYGCTSGAKQSMEKSYIPAALAAGARLYSQCKVVKLVRRGDRVVEAQAEFYRAKGVKAGVRLTVKARRFIIACGTLQTPVFLAQNGIGRQSGQLGRNLSLHPAAKTVAVFNREIDGIKGVPQGLGMEDLHAEGLLFEGVFLPPSLLAASVILPPAEHREIMMAYKRLAIFGFLVSDRSRGRVVGLPDGRPLILYTMDRRDRERFVKGLGVCARISFAAGAERVLLTTHSCPEMRSESEVEGFLRSRLRATDLEISAFHPLGTARMGVDPGASVVDAELRVHDLENVYIADGSIFPSSLGVNPQESIMAFATRLADHLHKEAP